jgi:hypothetical protein
LRVFLVFPRLVKLIVVDLRATGSLWQVKTYSAGLGLGASCASFAAVDLNYVGLSRFGSLPLHFIILRRAVFAGDYERAHTLFLMVAHCRWVHKIMSGLAQLISGEVE